MAKDEADRLKKIEISWLKKQGMLLPWYNGAIKWTHPFREDTSIGITVTTETKTFRLYYTQTEADGTKKDFNYEVRLAETKCNYGGTRFWFICPLNKNGIPCNRRVGVLYKGGDYFGCRHCYELTYSERNENRHSSNYTLFRALTLHKKIAEAEDQVKREEYAGKVTRRRMKVLKLQGELLYMSPTLRRDLGI